MTHENGQLRCESCRFWRRLPKPHYATQLPIAGSCVHAVLKVWVPNDNEEKYILRTTADFGCVQHEPYEPKTHRLHISDTIEMPDS
jgi:hypothetical protein